MPKPDDLLLVFFWAWFGFCAVFTIAIWVQVAALFDSTSTPGGSLVSRIPLRAARFFVGLLGVLGMLGTARLWAVSAAPIENLGAIAAWSGAVLALVLFFRLRPWFPKNNPQGK